MRDLDHALGNGGMPLLDTLGIAFAAYGEGHATATWTVTDACANPVGAVQAGVHGVALDAAMHFALMSALASGTRAVTLQMSVQTIAPALVGDTLEIRGTTTRAGRTVGYCTGEVRRGDEVIALGHATFAVQQRPVSR